MARKELSCLLIDIHTCQANNTSPESVSCKVTHSVAGWPRRMRLISLFIDEFGIKSLDQDVPDPETPLGPEGKTLDESSLSNVRRHDYQMEQT